MYEYPGTHRTVDVSAHQRVYLEPGGLEDCGQTRPVNTVHSIASSVRITVALDQSYHSQPRSCQRQSVMLCAVFWLPRHCYENPSCPRIGPVLELHDQHSRCHTPLPIHSTEGFSRCALARDTHTAQTPRSTPRGNILVTSRSGPQRTRLPSNLGRTHRELNLASRQHASPVRQESIRSRSHFHPTGPKPRTTERSHGRHW